MMDYIFDVDGVILDSMPYWNSMVENYLDKRGIEYPESLHERLFSMTFSEGCKFIAENYPLNKSPEKVFSELEEGLSSFYRYDVNIKEGARELLDFLKNKNRKLYLFTSSKGENIRSAFRRLDLEKYFRRLFSSEDLGISKGTREGYEYILKKIGKGPGAYYMVEDGLYSAKTAKNMGFKIIGVYEKKSPDSKGPLEEISDIYLKNLEDFRAYKDLL